MGASYDPLRAINLRSAAGEALKDELRLIHFVPVKARGSHWGDNLQARLALHLPWHCEYFIRITRTDDRVLPLAFPLRFTCSTLYYLVAFTDLP